MRGRFLGHVRRQRKTPRREGRLQRQEKGANRRSRVEKVQWGRGAAEQSLGKGSLTGLMLPSCVAEDSTFSVWREARPPAEVRMGEATGRGTRHRRRR